MSTALWVKNGNRLAPADEITMNLIAGYKQGDYIRTDAPRRPRNPKHHKLMMAILQIVVEHCWPEFADTEALIRELKFRTRMFERWVMSDGRIIVEFQSISFASMDQTSFGALAKAWLEIICTEFMPGTDPEELLKEAA